MQKRDKTLPYGRHWISEADFEAVKRVLESDFLTLGPRAAKFEEKLASYIGVKHALVVGNGTAALELALRACGVKPGDKVITTPFSFVASSNAVLFNGASVEFVDIEKDTFNLDSGLIEEAVSEQTKAILPVHFAGQTCEMQQIGSIAKKHDLVVVEDTAHALGAEFEGKKAGSFGKAGCFSFHPVKHITMGEGGAITTDSQEVFERLLLLRWHGIDRDAKGGRGIGFADDVKELSRNHRVSDIACALGLSQFERLEEFLQKREEIAKRYNEAFEGLEGITMPITKPGRKHAWHIYCVLAEQRDRLFKFLREQNIGVNVHYTPIYRHSLYTKMFGLNPSDFPRDFPNTEYVFKRIMALPLFPKMSNQDTEYVIAKVKEGLKALTRRKG